MILLSNTQGGRLVLNKTDDTVTIASIKPIAYRLKIFNMPFKNCNIRFGMFNTTQSIPVNITQAYEVYLARPLPLISSQRCHKLNRSK